MSKRMLGRSASTSIKTLLWKRIVSTGNQATTIAVEGYRRNEYEVAHVTVLTTNVKKLYEDLFPGKRWQLDTQFEHNKSRMMVRILPSNKNYFPSSFEERLMSNAAIDSGIDIRIPTPAMQFLTDLWINIVWNGRGSTVERMQYLPFLYEKIGKTIAPKGLQFHLDIQTENVIPV